MERNLERLFRMQREADEILRTSQELEAREPGREIDRFRETLADFGDAAGGQPYLESPEEMDRQPMSPAARSAFQPLDLYPFLGRPWKGQAPQPIETST